MCHECMRQKTNTMQILTSSGPHKPNADTVQYYGLVLTSALDSAAADTSSGKLAALYASLPSSYAEEMS